MDPRVDALAPVIASFGLHEPTIERVRARFVATASQIAAPDSVVVEHCELGGHPAIRVRRRDSAPTGRIMHLHGGGFVIGDVAIQTGVPAQLAVATGAEVTAVDYRVAPEHPCPAATEDAVSAYRDLRSGGTVDAIAGDSAGGALAILTAVALRDAGDPLPRSLVAFSPWTDIDRAGDQKSEPDFVDPVLPPSFLDMAAAAWLDGREATDPAATPARADLRELPPTMIHVGGAELLLHDALDLAARLSEAGVETVLHVWPEMIHVFVAYPQLAPESTLAMAEVAQFVSRG